MGAERVHAHAASIVAAMQPTQVPVPSPPRSSSRRHAVVATCVVALALVLAACSGGEAPQPEGVDAGTADPVLVEGRTQWLSSCARCHGASGNGGAGPALHSSRSDRPSVPAMTEVIVEGRGAMPAFGSSLDDDEIDAVVRYIDEVL